MEVGWATRERLPGDHRHVRRGTFHGRGRPRGLGLVRDRQHATALLSEVAEVVASARVHPGPRGSGLGRGGGARVEEALPAIDALRAQGHRVRLVYLDAPQDVLVRRFEGTRRRHPILERQVAEAITDERRLLEPVRARADVVVDTAELNVNQLREPRPRPLRRRVGLGPCASR